MRFGIQHIRDRYLKGVKTTEKPLIPRARIKELDNLLLIIAVIGPLVILPQIIKIFLLKDATSISAITFSLFALFDLVWIFYGVVYREKPIAISYSLWFIMNLTVVMQSIIY